MIKKSKSKKSDMGREKQTRFLSQAIQLEEAVNPYIIRATMIMVSMTIFVFVVWAGLTNINEVARTPGEVIPQGHQQVVQHFEGGIVQSIHAKDGDVVKKGDTLIVLDNGTIIEDLERAEMKGINLEMQTERLRAFLENRPLDLKTFPNLADQSESDQHAFFDGMKAAREKEKQVILDQIAEKKQSVSALNSDLKTVQQDLNIAMEMYDRRQELNNKGYVSDMQILEDKKKMNEINGHIKNITNKIIMARKEMNQYENRLESLSATHRDDVLEKLSEIEAEKDQNTKIIQKMQERVNRLIIRSPTDGLIKGLTVNTIGSVIQSGQVLMEVVPVNETLEVVVKISPQDIGHLKIGQPVQVKFSTFDFSRYGSSHGVLQQISATTFTGDRGNRYYQGRVSLSKNYVGHDTRNIILPGMTVMADIITGRKTILQYMLKPIHRSLKTAFTER